MFGTLFTVQNPPPASDVATHYRPHSGKEICAHCCQHGGWTLVTVQSGWSISEHLLRSSKYFKKHHPLMFDIL